jgi:hypothetical protein
MPETQQPSTFVFTAYTLTSKPTPRLRGGQETRLYEVMEELGGGPVTLDQIMKQCEYRRYGALLKTASIRESVEWHLQDWLKRSIVKKTMAGAST